MGLVRAFAPGAGSRQVVASNVLAAFGGNMLGEFQQKPHQGKGLGLALEVLTLGGEGYLGGVAILLDADLLQGKGFTGSDRKRRNADEMVQAKTGLLPVDEAVGQMRIDQLFLREKLDHRHDARYRSYVEKLARSPAGTEEAKEAERDMENLLKMYLRRARRE